MRTKRSAGRDKRRDRLENLLLGGSLIWRIPLVLPALGVAGAFFTGQSFGTKCSEPNLGGGGLAQVVFIALTTVALLGASAFIAPLKSATEGQALEVVKIRTEGLQWLVVATTGVGGACLALAATVNLCTWLGAGIALVGFFWGVGGLGAILLHCALVQVRLIQAEARGELADQ